MAVELRKNLKGCAHPRSKLLPGQAEQILLRYVQGATQRELAKEFHISQMTVFRIVWRQSYDTE